MPPSTPPPRFIGPGTTVAVVVVVAVAVASAIPQLSQGPRVLLLVSSSLYTLLATAGVGWAERVDRRRVLTAAVLVVVALGLVMILASGPSNAILAVMPAISIVVLYYSVTLALLLTALYAGALGFVGWRLGLSAAQVTQAIGGFLAAAAFVLVFSRLVVSERRARADVERLALALEDANARLREYAAKAEDLATTKERNRIARDIHDGLGHHLTAAHVQLEAARAVSEKDPVRALECVGRAQANVHEGLAEVRRAVVVLREGPVDARSLPEVVSGLVEECRASGIETRLTVEGEPRLLQPRVHATLFRVAQEALTNVRRHAQASCAALRLSYRPQEVGLSVEDDGIGARATEGGFGLLGVRERVQLLGGTVDVRTAEGAGFALEVRVPA
jgi:signal transduction histidine kinase